MPSRRSVRRLRQERDHECGIRIDIATCGSNPRYEPPPMTRFGFGPDVPELSRRSTVQGLPTMSVPRSAPLSLPVVMMLMYFLLSLAEGLNSDVERQIACAIIVAPTASQRHWRIQQVAQTGLRRQLPEHASRPHGEPLPVSCPFLRSSMFFRSTPPETRDRQACAPKPRTTTTSESSGLKALPKIAMSRFRVAVFYVTGMDNANEVLQHIGQRCTVDQVRDDLLFCAHTRNPTPAAPTSNGWPRSTIATRSGYTIRCPRSADRGAHRPPRSRPGPGTHQPGLRRVPAGGPSQGRRFPWL